MNGYLVDHNLVTVLTMAYEESTEKIIGCAYRVYHKLGFGFLESTYQKCLMIELRRGGMVEVKRNVQELGGS